MQGPMSMQMDPSQLIEEQDFVPMEFDDPNQSVHSVYTEHVFQARKQLATTNFFPTRPQALDVKPPMNRPIHQKSRIFAESIPKQPPATVPAAELKAIGKPYWLMPFINLDSHLYRSPTLLDKQQQQPYPSNPFSQNAQTRYVWVDDKSEKSARNKFLQHEHLSQTTVSANNDHHEDFPKESPLCTTQQFEVLNDITRLDIDFLPVAPIVAFNRHHHHTDAKPTQLKCKPLEQPRESIAIFSESPLLISYMMMFLHAESDRARLEAICKQSKVPDTDKFEGFKQELQRVVGAVQAKFQKCNDIIQFILGESQSIRLEIEDHTRVIEELIEQIVGYQPDQNDDLKHRCSDAHHATYLLLKRVRQDLLHCSSADQIPGNMHDMIHTANDIQNEFHNKQLEFEEQFIEYILKDDASILILYNNLKQGSTTNKEELEEINLYNEMPAFYQFLDSKDDLFRQVVRQYKATLQELESMISQLLNMHEQPFNALFSCCDTIEGLYGFLPHKVSSVEQKIQALMTQLLSIRIPHLSYEVFNKHVHIVSAEMLEKIQQGIGNFRHEIVNYFPLQVRRIITDPANYQSLIQQHQDRINQYHEGLIDRKMLFEWPLLFDHCVQQKQTLEDQLGLIEGEHDYALRLTSYFKGIPFFEQELLVVQQSRIAIKDHLVATRSQDVIDLDLADLARLSLQCEGLIDSINAFFQKEQRPITPQFIRLLQWGEAERFAIEQLHRIFKEKIIEVPQIEWVQLTMHNPDYLPKYGLISTKLI